MKHRDVETYISAYPKLANVSEKRVVLSFTIDDNLDNYKGFLNSILDQTVKVNSIDVNISNKDKDKNFVSSRYRDILSVHYIGADYGKFNGLLPTLERETDKDTIIIWVKPIYIYPSDMIQNLIENMTEGKSCSIKKNGRTVAMITSPDNVLSNCFYSATNNNPDRIKTQTLSDITKDILNIKCSQIYCL
jgi:hypothetical protein